MQQQSQAEKRVAQAHQHLDGHMLARRKVSCSSGACDPAWVASGIVARLAGWRHLCEIESGPTLEERGPEEESAMLSSEPDPSGSPWAPIAQTEFFDDLTGFALEPPMVRLVRIEEMNYLIVDLDIWGIVDRVEDFLEKMERSNSGD